METLDLRLFGGSPIIKLNIDVPPTWLARLFKSKPKQKTILITPTKLGVREVYSKHIEKLDAFSMLEQYETNKTHVLLAGGRMDSLVLAMGHILTNSEETPPKWLGRALKAMTPDEFDVVRTVVLKALDVPSFLKMIVETHGISLQGEYREQDEEANG